MSELPVVFVPAAKFFGSDVGLPDDTVFTLYRGPNKVSVSLSDLIAWLRERRPELFAQPDAETLVITQGLK